MRIGGRFEGNFGPANSADRDGRPAEGLHPSASMARDGPQRPPIGLVVDAPQALRREGQGLERADRGAGAQVHLPAHLPQRVAGNATPRLKPRMASTPRTKNTPRTASWAMRNGGSDWVGANVASGSNFWKA